MLSLLTSLLAPGLVAGAVLSPHAQQPLVPKTLTLDEIPLLGFGTWNLKGDNVSDAVAYAIEVGYRHIDCAAAYYNQDQVGIGIKMGLQKMNLTREDLWVTSKLWNDAHGKPEVVDAAITKTLQELGLAYLDLWHMHWPVTDTLFGHATEYLETWEGMTAMKEQGKVRHLGVSNFSPKQMKDLLNNTRYPPEVHQMELHPYLQQREWLDFHASHSIHVTAYSPLAGTNPTYDPGDPPHLLENKVVRKIAKKRDCSPAQVALAWGMSRGTSVIPKSIQKKHIASNFLASKCKLKDADLDQIDALGKYHHRYNNPSEEWGVKLYKHLEDWKGKHKIENK